MTVWLVGYPGLAQLLDRTPYAALAGRIQVRVQLKPVSERERFAQRVHQGLQAAGCQHTLLADSGREILRQASQGLPRQAGRILRVAMLLSPNPTLSLGKTSQPVRSAGTLEKTRY